jgi:hypothetical protein
MSEVLNLSKAAKASAKPGSMIEIVETALRQATWDATQGPDHLRAGRFDPRPPSETAKSSPRKG